MSDAGPRNTAAGVAQVDAVPIRDAATVLLMRQSPRGSEILMGQRGAGAAFMPSKYVFPGGVADPDDAGIPLARPLAEACLSRLSARATPGLGPQLAACALRELYEETGLILGVPDDWPLPPPRDWHRFAEAGYRPDASALTFVFRAITPAGRPRRFDARFFLADAGRIAGNVEDFSGACEELSHLHWVQLSEARRLNLPFITEVVLAEVAALIARGGPPDSVPFFDNSGPVPTFRRL
jgi:8-oxo-dGTP pyrophosphatase MutT (NUDIX family)